MSVSTREVQTDWSLRSRRSFCANISNPRDFGPDLPNHTRSQSAICNPQSEIANLQSAIPNLERETGFEPATLSLGS